MKIETPCTEDFSGMQRNNFGRHCSSCNKIVVDFTKMSTNEIKEHLSNATGEVCGRFKSLQLEQKNGFEKFIFYFQEHFGGSKLKPVRIVSLALLSGIAAFTSSCMGKVQTKYDSSEHEKTPESTQVNKQDSVQKK